MLLACRKNKASWDVDLVIPVTDSKLNLHNYLPDSLFKTDSTGLYHFKINREVANKKLDSLLQLPDTTFINSFTVPTPVPVKFEPGVAVSSSTPTETKFDLPNGIQLKKIVVRSSLLYVKFSNSIERPLDFIFQIPSATKNGSVFTIKETIPTGSATLKQVYSLDGYTLDLKGVSGTKYNTLVQNSTISVNPNVDAAIVLPGQGVIMEIGYSNVTPQLVEGWFGTQTLSLNNAETSIGFSQNFNANNFLLSDATFKFSIINQLGADFTGNINSLKSKNSFTPKTILLNNNRLDYLELNAARRTGDVVSASTLAVEFNTVNSNVTAFISNLPDKIGYNGSVTINPLGDQIKNYGQFAYYNTGIILMADIDIPLRFTANNFNLENTTKVDYSSNIPQLNNCNSGNFEITITNGFPFAAQVQAYMLNENNQVIDSIFSPNNNSITYGTLNEKNIVTQAAVSKLNIAFDKNKIENLKLTKAIKIKSKVLLPPSPPDIQILEQYEIDVLIVAGLNYKTRL
jgi:hypothetical protein